jgi:preprotein translocase subunit SecE
LSKLKQQWDRTVAFFQEVMSELKKTTFPSRRETMESTVVVLVVTFAVAIFLGLVDLLLSQGVQGLMR